MNQFQLWAGTFLLFTLYRFQNEKCLLSLSLLSVSCSFLFVCSIFSPVEKFKVLWDFYLKKQTKKKECNIQHSTLCQGRQPHMHSSGMTLQEAIKPTLLLWPQPSVFRSCQAEVHLTSYASTNMLYYLILLNKTLQGVNKMSFLIWVIFPSQMNMDCLKWKKLTIALLVTGHMSCSHILLFLLPR